MSLPVVGLAADEMQEGLREGSIRVEDEELLALAQEKETFMTAVTGCHEGHVTKIYRKVSYSAHCSC